jgi:hypothetical protein
MKRTVLNLLIDLAAGLAFLGMITTGYLLWFALPPGTNKLLSLWGLSRHQWGTVHSYISLVLLGILLIHLALHWQWLLCMVRRHLLHSVGSPKSPVRVGILSLGITTALVGLFAYAAHSGVQEITEPTADVCFPGVPENSSAFMTPSPDTDQAVDFWKAVYPIFEKKCVSCHGPTKQKGGFRADQPQYFFTADGGMPLVVPGKSEQSPLIAIVSGLQKDMPLPDRHKISEAEVTLLKKWIDTGANWPQKPASP